MSNRNAQSVSRRRKRPAPVVYGGLDTYEDKDNDFLWYVSV